MSNRMHPGKPPSQRTSPGNGQDGPLSKATRDLALKIRETFEYDDPTVRRVIVLAVRQAIRGESKPSDPPYEVEPEVWESVIDSTAMAYREALRRMKIHADDDIAVESFMSEVESVLDDVLALDWRSKVRKTTRMNVAVAKQMGNLEGAEAKAKILADVHEALGDAEDSDFYMHNPDARTPDEEHLVSMPGSFRIVFTSYDLDYRSPEIQAVILDVVSATLNEELPDPSSN